MFSKKTEKQPSSKFFIWMEQARYDLEIAKISKSSHYYEWACYQSTQCVEKTLKAILVHSGVRPPRIHKFGVLAGMANKINKDFMKVDIDFRKVEGYTFISRYPFLMPDQNRSPHEFINKNDADTCIAIAGDIYSKIYDFLNSARPKKGKLKTMEFENYYFTQSEVEERKALVISELLYSKVLDIDKIILYGSFAKESTRPRTSTMDILIVANTDLNFFERIQYVREITKGSDPIVEPLIYTPQEFDFMLKEEGEGYLESAIEEGVVLYQK